ncbi:isochorismate synthase [Ectothiorhodospira haloalkaliphila]|uniref:isochorismate synthase n=1 Tax=Ectothiorhodospira haloalkaliphila TaxID=421628 RepID=UPI001EE96F58|nr:isochorismate synthase [Ectothiorhodospira haloalkaliphila]MCG5525976.1 isochorismate synthase [Ectothiorhodospira haloalkaliphila]
MSSASQHPASPEQSMGQDRPGLSRDVGRDWARETWTPAPRPGLPAPARSPHERAVGQLLDEIKNWRFREGELLHAATPVPAVDPFHWLESNPGASRCLWQNREQTLTLAGIGAAAELSADTAEDYDHLLERINDIIGQQDTAFVGGFAFDGRSGEREWHEFPAARFVLPSIELRQWDGGFRLAVNLRASTRREFVRRKTRLIAELCRLRFTPPRPASAPWPIRVTRRVDDMSFDECQGHIRHILEHIQQGRIHKAVLARRVELQLNDPLPGFATLKRWHHTNGGSFCFALEHGHKLFMGCSPERLFSREDRRVCTESLAGTVRRGRSRQEDAQLEHTLLRDPKLIHEHELVTRYVRDRIAPWVTCTDCPTEAGVVKLDRIQHRYLPIRATLRPGVMDDQLLKALHPTPAVCGFPRREAQELIARRETTHRGWYSGVVGMISPRRSEFAVAIRSALVERNRVLCYSGVGIVEGSTPEAEWNELEAKIESFLAVLGS